MDQPRPITHDDLHETYVQRSIRELQHMIQREDAVLAELRRSVGAVPIASAEASLEIMATAYEEAARAVPFTPFPDSVLPALLAMRKTHQVTVESELYLAKKKKKGQDADDAPPPPLDKARRELAMDRARLADQQVLQAALEARVAELRAAAESRRAMTASQRRRERQQEKLAALRAKKREYDRDTSVLLKALKGFIQEQLGPMLAAEELGGPVVGDMVGIATDDLAAGFSSQGKLRKVKPKADATPGTKNKLDGRRQQRIDEIWGKKPREEGAEADEAEDDDSDNDGEDRDEATSAAAEMQELTEELLNALASAGGNSAAAYVTLARESAAARFLVRSKVAQFHPKDATRLRLIDFGRELDD